jgi:hypothetical protein
VEIRRTAIAENLFGSRCAEQVHGSRIQEDNRLSWLMRMPSGDNSTMRR